MNSDNLKSLMIQATCILKEIDEYYEKLNKIDLQIIDIMQENKLKKINVDLPEDHRIEAHLKYYANRIVDYKKVKDLYPDVYTLGLINYFSIDEASKFIDKKTLQKIIVDCSIRNPRYEIVYKRHKFRGNWKWAY